MVTETAKAGPSDRVLQFSVFTPNRVGRLHDLVGSLGSHGVHVLAMMVLNETDCAIVRVVVDDPQAARELLAKDGYSFIENSLVAVEATAAELGRLVSVLLEAELNINYLYSFIPHAHGKSILALSVEDNEIAEQALQRHQFQTLRQVDISR
jgi:hypothetical protein